MTRLLPILLLCGCQSQDFTDTTYLYHDHGPYAQTRRIAQRKALADVWTRQEGKRLRVEHWHRLATNAVPHNPLAPGRK